MYMYMYGAEMCYSLKIINCTCILISVLFEISFRKYMQNPNAIILCIQGKKAVFGHFTLWSDLSQLDRSQPKSNHAIEKVTSLPN